MHAVLNYTHVYCKSLEKNSWFGPQCVYSLCFLIESVLMLKQPLKAIIFGKSVCLQNSNHSLAVIPSFPLNNMWHTACCLCLSDKETKTTSGTRRQPIKDNTLIKVKPPFLNLCVVSSSMKETFKLLTWFHFSNCNAQSDNKSSSISQNLKRLQKREMWKQNVKGDLCIRTQVSLLPSH